MDPLLECLLIFSQINGQQLSAKSLVAGLPLVQNKLTPQLFVRAAKRAGYTARIMDRPLKKVSKLLLPAVILLKNNQACVLNRIDENNNAQVIFPDTAGGCASIPLEELNKDYIGYSIFLKTSYKLENRANEYNIATSKSWFWGTLWHYKNIYAEVIIAALFINLFALASPLFILNVYDRVVPNFAVETLWVLALGVAIVFAFDFLLKTLRGYLIDVAGKKADTIIASNLFGHALNIKMEAKPASSGAFANNLREFEVLRDFFTSATIASLIDLPFIFVFVAVIWMIGGAVGIVPLFAIPIIFLAAYFVEIPVRRAVARHVFGASQKHAILVEAINRIETIKSLSAEGSLQKKWERYVLDSAQSALKSRFFTMIAINFTAYILQMTTIVIVIIGVYLIAANELTMGGLIACVILSGRALAPMAQLAALLTKLNQSRIALQNLNKIMELPVEREKSQQFLNAPLFKKEIEFHNVSFSYPEQAVPALSNINLKIKMGEKVGLVGKMGTGKSTFEKLILKLYTPSEGAIFIDGIDITQIDPADLRHKIGYVSQDYSLLYGTVYENITMRTPWANDKLVVQAAKLAGVDAFVNKHPAGFHLPIGEQGAGVSGGQRQAITIARALITNPEVLLLDEPTSSIDINAERMIIKNLQQYAANKTLIITTQKPAMLSLVERLIVLDDGKVIADGPKAEVLKFLRGNAQTQQQNQGQKGA